MKYMKLVPRGGGKNYNYFDIDMISGNCGVIFVDTDNYVTYHPQTIIEITPTNGASESQTPISVKTVLGNQPIPISYGKPNILPIPLTSLEIFKNDDVKTINIKSIDPCYLDKCSIVECKNLEEINGLTKALNSRDCHITYDMTPIVQICKNLKKFDSVENVKLTGYGGWGLCGQLPNNIVYDFQKVDASNFKGSIAWGSDQNGIENFDFSNMNINQVTSLQGFFAQNHNLKRVRGIETIDFSNVKNINSMFRDCENLVDIEGFQNIKIADNTQVDILFHHCDELWAHEDVDLTNLKNCKPYYYSMFNYCTFKSLNLSGWKIPTKFNDSLTWGEFYQMFDTFKGEKLILHGWDLTKNQDGINHKAYTKMFNSCNNLKEIDLGPTTQENVSLWSQLLKKDNLDPKILKYTL